jgi:Glyoxalase-like domain
VVGEIRPQHVSHRPGVSNRRLDGTRERYSVAVVVLPQPKVRFSQTITWSCYEPRTQMPPVGRAGWCQRLHACWRRHIASTKERPMAVSFQLVIDCADPEPLARFWAAALGYELEPPHRIPSSATRLAVGSTLSGQHDLVVAV